MSNTFDGVPPVPKAEQGIVHRNLPPINPSRLPNAGDTVYRARAKVDIDDMLFIRTVRIEYEEYEVVRVTRHMMYIRLKPLEGEDGTFWALRRNDGQELRKMRAANRPFALLDKDEALYSLKMRTRKRLKFAQAELADAQAIFDHLGLTARTRLGLGLRELDV